MTISLLKAMGIACAIISFQLIAPATAAPLAPAPSADNAVARVAPAKTQRARKAPFRSPAFYTYRSGNADLAFLSAGQYLNLSSVDSDVSVVSADELSVLDIAAGGVRVVSPDEVNEIDLATEPTLAIAQETTGQAPLQVASAAPAKSGSGEEDDGVLNRILMTFAGALAMAGAMRMILA